jgi:hypothetical protein
LGFYNEKNGQELLMSEKRAQLTIDGSEPIDLPVYQGSTGPDVIDVRSLVSKGVFTYDPGFVSTAACDSKSHTLMGMQAFCCIEAIRSSN